MWHKDTGLDGMDCVILPGGFSYGDYLRPGAMARFSPVMDAVQAFAEAGGTVIGICNGFQILCESGLLPGVLRANRQLEFRCQWTGLRVERTDTRFSSTCTSGQILQVPISHGEGNYYADAGTLEMLEREGQSAVPLLRRFGPMPQTSVEPQRLREQHCRHHQRGGQRAGHDAPPGALLRGAAGRNGRSADLPVDCR